MNDISNQKEFLAALEKERRIVRSILPIQIAILVVAFVLMHDTRWYDALGYKRIGMFLLFGSTAIIPFVRLVYINAKWPTWFHEVEKKIHEEFQGKSNPAMALLLIGLYLICGVGLILGFTLLLFKIFDDTRYALVVFQYALLLFIIGFLIKLHFDVIKQKQINLHHGYAIELCLLVFFGILLPFILYHLIEPNSYHYTTYMTVRQHDKTPSKSLQKLLDNYDMRGDCLDINPCSSLTIQKHDTSALQLIIHTEYKGARIKDAFLKHKQNTNKIVNEIETDKSFSATSIKHPQIMSVRITRPDWNINNEFSLYSLLVAAFLSIYSLVWKDNASTAYWRIKDYLKRHS